MVPVMTSTRRPLRGEKSRARPAARHRPSAARPPELSSGDHNSGRPFRRDDDDVGQRLEIEFSFLVNRIAGFLVEPVMHRAGSDRALGFGFHKARHCSVDVAHRRAWTFLVTPLPSSRTGHSATDNGLFGSGHATRRHRWNTGHRLSDSRIFERPSTGGITHTAER